MPFRASKNNIQFHDKIRKLSKISLNVCFLELSEEYPRDSKRVRISHGVLKYILQLNLNGSIALGPWKFVQDMDILSH